MATNQNNDQANFDQIGASITTMDASRAAELGNSQKMQTIRNNALVKEQARLTAKKGQNDPLVIALTGLISYNPDIDKAFSQEISRLQVPSTPFDPATWRITGRVFDANGNPVNNVTVFLSTDGIGAIQGAPYSCTDADGSYSITLPADFVTKMANTSVRLGVSDSNKTTLTVTSDAFTPTAGVINNYLIYLSSGQCTTPPTASTENPIQ